MPADERNTEERPPRGEGPGPAERPADVPFPRPEKRERTPPTDRELIFARISQFVDYAFYLLYSLLGIRFILTLLGADPAAGFVRFINNITSPFYAPFDGIVESVVMDGRYVLDIPLIIAAIVYVMLHVAIIKLLRTIAHRRTTI